MVVSYLLLLKSFVTAQTQASKVNLVFVQTSQVLSKQQNAFISLRARSDKLRIRKNAAAFIT